MWSRITHRVDATTKAVERRLRSIRAVSPMFDHLARAYRRYHDQRGDRRAAAVTYYGFLSFFPLLAVAYAVIGLVVRFIPDAREGVAELLRDAFPGIVGTADTAEIRVQDIQAAGTRVGLIGLAVLLWTGLGWLSALREALREMWSKEDKGHNLVIGKLHDLSTLILIGLMLLVSITLSGLTSVGGHRGLPLRLGLEAVTVATYMAVLIAMYWRLSGAGTSPMQLWRGALVGALGFEVLRALATFLLGRLTGNPVYTTFAIAVGLLVWINLGSRLILYSAAWTATRPYLTERPIRG